MIYEWVTNTEGILAKDKTPSHMSSTLQASYADNRSDCMCPRVSQRGLLLTIQLRIQPEEIISSLSASTLRCHPGGPPTGRQIYATAEWTLTHTPHHKSIAI
ncbi:hypothetical protein Pmani_034396 [Petrolisthes manimaculis]|uniref:Uncharacterized protein n=1 Tax=Petrolisthes manimaculis TaxID=1843537 RepID=A0AAE1TRK9_9EUCA|nr:hypothetical protein Pmani_034396 [Petrolisthes manimaculis]